MMKGENDPIWSPLKSISTTLRVRSDLPDAECGVDQPKSWSAGEMAA